MGSIGLAPRSLQQPVLPFGSAALPLGTEGQGFPFPISGTRTFSTPSWRTQLASLCCSVSKASTLRGASGTWENILDLAFLFSTSELGDRCHGTAGPATPCPGPLPPSPCCMRHRHSKASGLQLSGTVCGPGARSSPSTRTTSRLTLRRCFHWRDGKARTLQLPGLTPVCRRPWARGQARIHSAKPALDRLTGRLC